MLPETWTLGKIARRCNAKGRNSVLIVDAHLLPLVKTGSCESPRRSLPSERNVEQDKPLRRRVPVKAEAERFFGLLVDLGLQLPSWVVGHLGVPAIHDSSDADGNRGGDANNADNPENQDTEARHRVTPRV